MKGGRREVKLSLICTNGSDMWWRGKRGDSKKESKSIKGKGMKKTEKRREEKTEREEEVFL